MAVVYWLLIIDTKVVQKNQEDRKKGEKMKKVLGLVFVVALMATPAMAQKVTVDYAQDFAFSTAKTFQYVETKDSNIKNQLMADRITTMLKKELAEGGLKEVTDNPDIYVTYHATSKENTSYNTTSMGFGGYGGYYGGWGGYGMGGMGGMGSSTTYATTYTEGTLIFDAYEPVGKKLVWRGTGTVTVKAKPEKQIKQVDNILKKLGKRWDKILAGKGK
jgi:hypothetical protein